MKRIIAAAVGIGMLLGTTAFADSITLSLGDNISQTVTQQEQQRAISAIHKQVTGIIRI